MVKEETVFKANIHVFFLFLALVAILCIIAEKFSNFGNGSPKQQSYEA